MMGSSVEKRSNIFLYVLLFHVDAVDLFCGLSTRWHSSSHDVKDVLGHFDDTGVFRELLEIDSVRQPQRVPLAVLLSSVLQRNLGSSLASEQDQVLPVVKVDMVDRSVVPERLSVLPWIGQQAPSSILKAVIPPAVVGDAGGRDHKIVVKEIHRVSTKADRRNVPHQAVALGVLTEDLHLPGFGYNKSNSFFTAELVR